MITRENDTRPAHLKRHREDRSDAGRGAGLLWSSQAVLNSVAVSGVRDDFPILFSVWQDQISSLPGGSQPPLPPYIGSVRPPFHEPRRFSLTLSPQRSPLWDVVMTVTRGPRRFGAASDCVRDSKIQMPAFKNPGFQDRQQAAAQAKSEALAKYRTRPPVDEALMAERAARRRAREQADAEKRAAFLRAKEEAAEAKRELERQAIAAAEAAAQAKAEAAAQAKAEVAARKVSERTAWTEEDRKAARDARYAARKMRQGRR